MKRYRNIGMPVGWILLWALVVITRWIYLGKYAESWDAVDFALALERYDILAMQPHFPGYPLLILFAQVAKGLFRDPILSLSAVSAFFGCASALLFYDWMKRWFGGTLLPMAGMSLFAFNPLIWLTSVQPMSESMGLFGVLLTWWLCSLSIESKNPWRITLAATVIYGLTLGVRLSYFPIGTAILLPFWLSIPKGTIRETFYRTLLRGFIVLSTFTAVILVWMLPIAIGEGGLASYWKLGEAFTEGHFNQWGGTIVTDPYVGQRLWAWVITQWIEAGWFGIGKGDGDALPFVAGSILSFSVLSMIPAIAVSVWGWAAGRVFRGLGRSVRLGRFGRLGGIGGLPVGETTRLRAIFLWFCTVPYSLWLLVGQNADKPRHILPLLPIYLVLLIAGWSQWRSIYKIRFSVRVVSFVLIGLMLAGSFFRGLELIQRHAQTAPPVYRLVEYVSQNYPANDTLLFTWEEQRIFDYYQSSYRVERVLTLSYFIKSVLAERGTFKHLLITNAVLKGFGASAIPSSLFTKVASFETDPLLDPVYHSVILYEATPQFWIWLRAYNDQQKPATSEDQAGWF